METLDLSNKSLKKINRSFFSEQKGKKIQYLSLNNNKLQILENLEVLSESLTQLTAVKNKIINIKKLRVLHNLTALDLSFNNIINLDGLETLMNLKIISLNNNQLSDISYLRHNMSLQTIDVANNCITKLSDISRLQNLRTLILDGNNIDNLTDAKLPPFVTSISLNCNNLMDLHEIRGLGGLIKLESLSILGNQCIQMEEILFDYRPYILNWCSNLKKVNNKDVDELERLRGEWLFSQGKGRFLHPGGHLELVKYLIKCFPLNEALRSAQDQKLKVVLRKQIEHREQLGEASIEKVKAALTIQKFWRKYLLKRSSHSKQNIRETETDYIKNALASLKIRLEKERQLINSFNALIQKLEEILQIMEESQRSLKNPRPSKMDASTQTESVEVHPSDSVNELTPSSTPMPILTNPILRFLSNLFDTEEED